MSDYQVGDTLYFNFTTRAFATGIPTVLAGTPVISIYEDNSTTQITAGITLIVSLDSVAGLNNVAVVATGGNGFETGRFYSLVITTGTVGGVSVIGEVVGSFSLEASAAALDLANGTDGLGAIKGDTAGIADVPTVTEFNARTIPSADYFDPAADAVANVTTVATTTTNTDMRGTDSALLAASAPTNFGDLSIDVTTGLVNINQTAADKVWSTTVRLLTAGTNIVLAKGVGLTGLNDIAATAIVSSGAITTSGGAVSNVTLTATTTTNTDMRGTDSALLASSAPTNFSSQIITAGGAVDALIQGFLNTAITETSAGRISNNFDFFYDNANAQTTQVVDDVGGGGGGGTDWTASERNEIRGRLGVTGTTAAGGNTPTLSLQSSVDSLNDFNPASDDVAVVTLVTTTTTNTDMRGTDSAATASSLSTTDGKIDDIQGATFSTSTDSLEAIRNRGDVAWITGGGGGIADILNIQPLIPNDIDLADTATYRLGMMLINSLDDLPTTAEITPGTISIDRKAIGGTSWTSVVSDAACSELAGLIYFDEVFDSGTGYAEGDSIRITLKSQLITVSANDFEISDSNGRIFYTNVRQTMRGTNSALLASGYTAPDNAGITSNGNAIAALNDFNPGVDVVASVTLVATTTTNTDMRGTDSALLAASYTAPDNAGISSNGTAIAALNDFDPASDPVANVTLVATTTTNTDMVAEPTTLFTTQMSESYSSVGVAPTMAQSLFLIQQALTEFNYAGTVWTVRRINGTTTAATGTLDDATDPTDNTRAS